MDKIGSVEDLFGVIEFDQLVEKEQRSKRISTKIMILAICSVKDGATREDLFLDKDIETNLVKTDNLTSEELREKIGIHKSKRAIDELRKSMKDDGYLKEDNRRPKSFYITQKGALLYYEYIWSLYRNLEIFELNYTIRRNRKEITLGILSRLGDIQKDISELEDNTKDKLVDMRYGDDESQYMSPLLSKLLTQFPRIKYKILSDFIEKNKSLTLRKNLDYSEENRSFLQFIEEPEKDDIRDIRRPEFRDYEARFPSFMIGESKSDLTAYEMSELILPKLIPKIQKTNEELAKDIIEELISYYKKKDSEDEKEGKGSLNKLKSWKKKVENQSQH
jgi:hypothetical protein